MYLNAHYDGADLPDSIVERVAMIEGIMITSATGGAADEIRYAELRREFISNEQIKHLLPPFVRIYRTLSAFWPYIKAQESTYAGRREVIREAFTPLLDYLEGVGVAPSDLIVLDALESFDVDAVYAVWQKALARRKSDPEGAITSARTLLETVMKRILDECQLTYTDKEDLPKLYTMAAEALNLTPDQHSEKPIKAILGNAAGVVNGLGSLRNKLSDAHGRGGKLPVRPAPRHASLAVNIAGAMATFLVETYIEKHL